MALAGRGAPAAPLTPGNVLVASGDATTGYRVGEYTLAGALLHVVFTSPFLGRVLGALLGAMVVFLFSAFAIRAVGRAAQTVIEEVRRQLQVNRCN